MAFQCNLVTPEREVFDQSLEYASIPAWDGLLGIATQRAPLLVKLGDGPLRIDLPGNKSESYFIGGGFAQMRDNKLSLVASEAIPAGEINAEETRAALKEAEARVATTDEDVAKKQREISRARAMLELAK